MEPPQPGAGIDCVALYRAMFRQVAHRLASTARRGITSSAVCREEGGKGPEGISQEAICI